MINRIRRPAVEKLSAALEQLYSPVGIEEFPRHVFGVFATMFSATKMTFDTASTRTGSLKYERSFDVPREDLWTPEMGPIIKPEHPAVQLILEGHADRTYRLTDLGGRHKLRNTVLFNEVWKLSEIRYQMLALFDIPGYKIGITFNRDLDFSDEELAVLKLMVPHVDRALFYAQLFSALKSQKNTPSVEPTELSDRYQLTQREVQVLHWLAQGKRDREIAIILNISFKTVGKHVGQILFKLGVETRGAAAAMLY